MTDLLIRIFIKDTKNIHDSSVREKYGLLSGSVGILCNVFLCVLKFTSGVLSSSISIIADAFNNLSDAASSIVTLVCFKIANKPADKQHPFGHGRVEYISGLIVSLAIIFMGIELIETSIDKMFSEEIPDFSWFSVAVLIVSMIIKLWMSVFNRKLSEIINSISLKTVSMDSLSDVIVTSTVLLGMIVSYYTGLNVDSYAGIIVALFIIYTGINTAKDTLGPLLGQKPDKEFVEKIKNKVLEHKDVIGVHDILVHNYGPANSLISLHAEVPSNMSILRLHGLIDNIECELKREFRCTVIIHMDPVIDDNEILVMLEENILKYLSGLDKDILAQDFRIIQDEGKVNVIFDLILPNDCKMSNDETTKSIKDFVRTINDNYRCIINVRRS